MVNVSLGHSKAPNCKSDPCAPADFADAGNWLLHGIESATDWRELGANRDSDVLIVAAAGNEREEGGGKRYPLLRNARTFGDFALGAHSLVFSSLRLSIFQDFSRFEADAAYADFPSLYPDADRLMKLTNYINAWPIPPKPANNVIIVGSTTNGPRSPLTESSFSNADPDVHAVGESVNDVADESGSKDFGTSVAAPQVAGLASYLLLLSPTLRASPMSLTKQAILDNAFTDLESPGVFLLDAYASILSLDSNVTPRPATAPIRLALLDVTGDGVFNQDDVEDFASVAFGAATYQVIGQPYNSSNMTFDESAVTDLDVLLTTRIRRSSSATRARVTGASPKSAERRSSATAEIPGHLAISRSTEIWEPCATLAGVSKPVAPA